MGRDFIDRSGKRYCCSLAPGNFKILLYKLTAELFLNHNIMTSFL
jgi:hypothetical protein